MSLWSISASDLYSLVDLCRRRSMLRIADPGGCDPAGDDDGLNEQRTPSVSVQMAGNWNRGGGDVKEGGQPTPSSADVCVVRTRSRHILLAVTTPVTALMAPPKLVTQ